ncbi:hypothetical protein GRF29_213g309590 [Pseudopithomyces chartarum]|uniref:Methyltransferase domain-containing protein n=1 Tax=Pseudopithomyces chartarum TaxID=1892770 RepID=A0AAN6RCU7_9PLEO|nr:hypothetical protein GRF29_213g309590 [Pseudopithomyces chartarum]
MPPSFSTPYVNALQTFYNTVGKSYNNMTSKVHAGGPERLIAAAGPAISPGSSILDLATGTGKVALLAAQKVGPSGHILGIDISSTFVDIAREEAAKQGVASRVEFLHRDVTRLDLPAEKYAPRWADAVTCGSAIMMFPEPKKMLGVLATEVLKPGGVLVADAWGPVVPAKVFLDVAVPRGFVPTMDPRWLSEADGMFERLFEGTEFDLVRVEREGESEARFDVGTEEKIEALWKSMSVDQTWLNFGLEKLDEGTVLEIKKAWIEELKKYTNDEGSVVAKVGQWIAVAALKE